MLSIIFEQYSNKILLLLHRVRKLSVNFANIFALRKSSTNCCSLFIRGPVRVFLRVGNFVKLSFSLMSCPGSKIWQWVVTRVRFNIFWLFSRQFATATASQCSSDFPEQHYLNRYTSTPNQWLKPQRLTFQPRNLTIPTQKLYHSYPEALPFLPRSFTIPTQKL